MICSVILVFVWSLVHSFLENLWESSYWQLILSLTRLRCGVHSLSEVAKDEPQASFAVLTKSLQFEWNHIQ